MALISVSWLWPHQLINEHVIVSTIGCHTPTQGPYSLSCQKPALCKVRVMFSKPVHAVRAGGGPPGTNHGLFKAKPSSYHVHSTLPVTPAHLPLSHPFCWHRTSVQRLFSAQCAVWCNQKLQNMYLKLEYVIPAEVKSMAHNTLNSTISMSAWAWCSSWCTQYVCLHKDHL